MKTFIKMVIESLVVLVGLALLWNACMNPDVGEDASLGAGIAGVFCIISGSIWLFES